MILVDAPYGEGMQKRQAQVLPQLKQMKQRVTRGSRKTRESERLICALDLVIRRQQQGSKRFE